MNNSRQQDALMHALSLLPTAAPDTAHTARVRARCHAAIERGARHAKHRGDASARVPAALFCVAYLVEMLRVVVTFYRE